VAAVDSLNPDILVSIHHNAQNDRDPNKNAVETYYRFGDPGSRDLAFAIHRHLMRNLGIEEGEIKPGNYYILRNIDVPAILGEGSYLTHPGVENNLRLSEKQRLEAEAYFLGILEYFSRGTPRLKMLAPHDSVLTTVPVLAFDVDDVGGLGIDPAGIDLKINGSPVTAYLNGAGSRITYSMSWDSPNGNYETAIAVRNILGNSSRVHRVPFRLDLPPVSATFENSPAALPHAGGSVRIRARLLDERGISVADSTAVSIATSAGAAPPAAFVHDGFVEFPLTVNAGAKKVTVTLSSRGRDFDAVLEQASGDPGRSLTRFVIVDSLSRKPLHHAFILVGDSLVANGSNSGVYFLPADFRTSGRPHWFMAPGYQPWIADSPAHLAWADTLLLTPWYDGLLVGIRFVLDPEGGFGAGPGRGELGLSGSHANLQVARYLAEYLRAAGANVLLTRTSEQTLSPRDVIDVTNKFGANRYIEIRHRNAHLDSALAVDAFFFPGSRTGSAMASVAQAAIATTLGLQVRAARDLVTFPLQQTACPAIVIEYPSIGNLGEELRLAEPWYQRVQAYGLFAGIIEHYGATTDSTLTIRLISGLPASNWLVTIDKTWSLLTGPDGIARFPALGRHHASLIEVRQGASRHEYRPDVAKAAYTISVSPSR
jgi:N-acetylmuramoyl-L-alanine amidase